MTFDQLEMLEAIIQHGTHKAAAESLHKSQPSLSVGIKKMEEEYGISLFDRSEYRLKLTPQGKVFYRWASECLEAFRNLKVVGQEMGQKKTEPTLTISLDPLVEFDQVHPVFSTCLGPHTVTELTIRSEILDRGMVLVLAGEADLAIGPILRANDKLESFFFRQVEMIPVCSRKLAPDFKKLPQIVVRSSATQGELSKGPKCYVSDHSMKCKLILEGHGWGRLARHEIEEEFKAKSLVKVNDHVVKSFTLDLHVMRNKQKAQGPIAREIWQKLKK